jgi:hypothetical protein
MVFARVGFLKTAPEPAAVEEPVMTLDLSLTDFPAAKLVAFEVGLDAGDGGAGLKDRR